MIPEPTPLRPAEQVVGAFIPVILGGKDFRLNELPRRANGDWLAVGLAAEVRAKLAEVGPLETMDQVVGVLVQSAEAMMDLLISYDIAGAKARKTDPVLPDREWIDTTATDRECYEAFKKVTKIALPFGVDLLTLIPELRPMLMNSLSKGIAIAAVTLASSRSTSGSPPNITGQPTTSSPTSPTRSSPSTSTRPRRGASKPPSLS